MFVHRDGSGRIIDVTGSVNRAELEKLLKEQDDAEKKAKKASAPKVSAKPEDKPAAKSDDKPAAKSEDKPSEKSLPAKHAGSDKPTEKAAGTSPPAKKGS